MRVCFIVSEPPRGQFNYLHRCSTLVCISCCGHLTPPPRFVARDSLTSSSAGAGCAHQRARCSLYWGQRGPFIAVISEGTCPPEPNSPPVHTPGRRNPDAHSANEVTEKRRHHSIAAQAHVLVRTSLETGMKDAPLEHMRRCIDGLKEKTC